MNDQELESAMRSLVAALSDDVQLCQTRAQHIRASQRLALAEWILEKAGVAGV